MKIILLLSLLFVCVVIGIYIKQTLHKKFLFYNSLCCFVEEFIVNVNFSQESFRSFIAGRGTGNSDLDRLLQTFLDDGGVKHTDVAYLQEDRVGEVYKMISQIGLTDAENQIEILNNFKALFEKRKTEAEAVDKKYSSLAVKMSILIGLLVDIIFI